MNPRTAVRHLRNSPGLLVGVFEFVGRYVLFFQGNIELAMSFHARAFGISQEKKLSTVNREPLNCEPV
jgi:hypothetical protein